MNHSNQYAVGLALCTFANISSEEMSRDLCNEVEKLLGSSNTYIRKKAALCALRIVRRVPELLDHFIEGAKSLLTDRNHGVLLSGITLVSEMCQASETCLDEFRKATTLLVRHLKSLITTGYSPEHDVSGITDPFLQTKILRLLRQIGRNDARASEAMNDILAQVATNTDSTKNVGNAILYETVLTVLEIEADSGLRVMAINILGKFLSNRDNNIRYVALNTLNKVVAMDTNAVQRHRNIILDCLRDGDISIRRRALELSYALVNETNVRVLIRELLAFLEVADNEFKLGMTTQISLAAERFAPNKRWHIDTVLRVLKLAGNYVREEVLSSFIRLVCHTPELQAYTTSKLYTALKEDISQESLTLATVWLLGEFGEVLIQGGLIQDSDIVDLEESILQSPYANALIRQFVLTSLAKLSARPALSEAQRTRIVTVLNGYATSTELEIQQRAVEFASLFSHVDIRAGVLEVMPPPEIKATVIGTVSEKRSVGSTRTDKDSLLDLMGDEPAATPSGGAASATPAQTTNDLLADLFGGGSAPAATPSSPAGAPPKNSIQDILGLFDATPATASPAPASAPALTQSPAMNGANPMAGLFDAAPAQAPAPVTPRPAAPAAAPNRPTFVAYENHGLKVTLVPQVLAARPGMIQIQARFEAISGPVSGVSFQVAVPRTQQLQMLPMSSADVQPGAVETQNLKILAPPGSQVKLRIRVGFTAGGNPIQEQVDFAGFPASMTNGVL
ncbi:clathrin associated protein complex large subunit [Ceratobasidium sp. 428]|nr:clathrin associated protein complex large subunit [Ceratobasidium sp. 428]